MGHAGKHTLVYCIQNIWNTLYEAKLFFLYCHGNQYQIVKIKHQTAFDHKPHTMVHKWLEYITMHKSPPHVFNFLYSRVEKKVVLWHGAVRS